MAVVDKGSNDFGLEELTVPFLSYSKNIWDQLFTVDTIWYFGETGDIDSMKRLQK